MIKTEKMDRDVAPIPYAAILDARVRNAVGITHFSLAEQRKTIAMQYALDLCYVAKAVYINWRHGGKTLRPKFAAIKLEYPNIRDRKMLNMLENGWKTDPLLNKVVKKETPQGILYRVYFK